MNSVYVFVNVITNCSMIESLTMMLYDSLVHCICSQLPPRKYSVYILQVGLLKGRLWEVSFTDLAMNATLLGNTARLNLNHSHCSSNSATVDLLSQMLGGTPASSQYL